jgi:hypothetical protein
MAAAESPTARFRKEEFSISATLDRLTTYKACDARATDRFAWQWLK